MEMQTLNQSTEPKLAPPGAGIPFYQKWALKLLIGPLVAGKSNWVQNWQGLHRVNQKIMTLLVGLTSEQMKQKILVPPQRGLEDSSRYWSIAMTLEHLLIVDAHMKNLMIELSHGRVPDVVVDTATVKPLGAMSPEEAIQKFKIFSETVEKEVEAKLGDRECKARLKHPWFGPSTAKQWQWVMMAHHGVHYQQLKEIKKRLLLGV